jgi:hypothetical protein
MNKVVAVALLLLFGAALLTGVRAVHCITTGYSLFFETPMCRAQP